ncbi:MAG: ferrochelatase [Xanthomonadales bacterium]|nr:ferrochelatase [Xanthomonadales bacterium]
MSPQPYDHRQAERSALLLVNLGTPTAPTPAAVRRYLAQFLGDRRVVDLPRLLWWPILHGIILRVRPARSARAYARVWTEEGSPLLLHTRALSESVAAQMRQAGWPDLQVAFAMTYGEPSIPGVIEALRQQGVRRLAVLPLYPQYSGTTTAAVNDQVMAAVSNWPHAPELRLLSEYHADPAWIEAVAASVRRHWDQRGTADRLLFSFHGIPRRYFLAGDPYHCQCLASARRIARALGLSEQDYHVSFQSRVGREEWLRPYTDELLAQWGREGVGRVQVLCPGFAVDCLETLEEIAMENAEHFRQHGGQALEYIPCLNADPAHASALASVAERLLAGWQNADPGPAQLDARQTRARALAVHSPNAAR